MYISSIKEQLIQGDQGVSFGCNSLFLCTLAVLRNSSANGLPAVNIAVIRFFYVH